ncbi:MAG: hypothetical protein ACTSRR_05465 [Candidatus Heimdallarchaeaceae archaeon]
MNKQQKQEKSRWLKENFLLLLVSLITIFLGIFLWFKYDEVYYLIFTFVTVSLFIYFLYKKQ